MQLLAPERRLRSAVKQGWTRFISATRPHYRLPLRRRPARTVIDRPLVEAPAPEAAPAVDPVALTVLAVNRLGPATLRTVANGKPLTVTVPDAHVGAIFKAALAEMQKTRSTDRLINIVIADETQAAAHARSNA
jgi:hypothetical protein